MVRGAIGLALAISLALSTHAFAARTGVGFTATITGNCTLVVREDALNTSTAHQHVEVIDVNAAFAVSRIDTTADPRHERATLVRCE